jgi:hypothetical protein
MNLEELIYVIQDIESMKLIKCKEEYVRKEEEAKRNM